MGRIGDQMAKSAQLQSAGGASVSDSAEGEFDAYVRRREGSLLRTAYLLTGNSHEAEDLVQTALTQLYRSWDKVRDPDSLDGYVRRIMVNANNSAWRKPWRRREVSSVDLVAETIDPLSPDPDTRRALGALIKTLPPKQRTVIVLRYYEDLPATDIADLLGVSPGTVRSQANRAIAALRAHPHLADLEDWA